MKRIFKLRVWDGKKMVFGPTEDNPNASWVLAFASAMEFPVMQYTELNDKNDIEIYEGDIVSHQNGIQEVLYDNNTASFQMSLNSFVLDQEVCDYDSVEVIGNIYENSNLTEGNNAN